MTQEEINDTMNKYLEINNKIKELKEQKEELRTELLLYMKMNDTTSVENDICTASYTMNKRRSFDKEKAIVFIEEKGGEPNAFFTESEFETLKVKAKGGGSE